jgi:spoIIIJ-associated protein
VEQVEKSATSVDEAKAAALEELGLEEVDVEFEIVKEPKGGFLGLGSQEAVVIARRRKSSAETTEAELDDQADVAADFLEDLLELMDLEVEIETHLEDGTMYVEIWGSGDEDEMGILIGKHGSVLDGLQELVRVHVGQKTGARCRVIVDVEDYQKRRRSRLVSKAKDAGKRVQKSGKPERLEPMNAFERKIVHDAVAAMKGLESESEGQDPDRRVVISQRD